MLEVITRNIVSNDNNNGSSNNNENIASLMPATFRNDIAIEQVEKQESVENTWSKALYDLAKAYLKLTGSKGMPNPRAMNPLS
ncbi:hypothetical protein G6F56_009072 [Rhizopus delemar]|nr:hypothetical protein G6F56_009072 [Rhizopus delemar]